MGQIADIKDMVTDGDTNLDERINMILGRIQDRVKVQIDENLLELKNRFNENLDLIEGKFKQNNTQIKEYVDKSMKQAIDTMEERRKEQDTLLEGRCQAFTVESERKLIQKINLLFGRLDALKDTMQRRGPSKDPEKSQPGVEPGELGEREIALKEWAL